MLIKVKVYKNDESKLQNNTQNNSVLTKPKILTPSIQFC